MCAARVQFGILSNYEETVFLYRQDDTLFMSAVCTRSHSPLLQVLMFLYIAQLPERQRKAFFKVPWGTDDWWRESKKILEQPEKPGIHPACVFVFFGKGSDLYLRALHLFRRSLPGEYVRIVLRKELDPEQEPASQQVRDLVIRRSPREHKA